MKTKIDEKDLKYLSLLAEKYPTVQDVCTEIINLKAILNLPKGTEHFMSDLHGEAEAFYHIMNNCSGVIREKVDMAFDKELSKKQRSDLCTLIYYPEQKLKLEKKKREDMNDWYRITLHRLLTIVQIVSSKYTRSKVRKAMPADYRYIIEELLHTQSDQDFNQQQYHNEIIKTIISLHNADDFIIAMSTLIKRLAVDHLHIVGDIFDRGPRPDTIMDMLMDHHSCDIQWGNHDILWMGAAAGSEVCIATVVRLCVNHKCIHLLESGYGISLRKLNVFANEVYLPTSKDIRDAMHRAMAVIMYKLEAQLIHRHPEYKMENRLLLEKIDYENKCIEIDGNTYALKTVDFPTVDPNDPYTLTPEEQDVLDGLVESFKDSERLHRHVEFLYSVGSLYKCFNNNLLFHACVPMNADGSFTELEINGQKVKGKALMDLSEEIARDAYFSHDPEERRYGQDFMYYLWSGPKSPIFGRAKMTTFERQFIEDKSIWAEAKDDYYTFYTEEETCDKILREFGLNPEFGHIINGHVPVKASKGENPVKANGKMMVIDGGFCKAYQKTTGIAGYTLIFNSHGMRIVSHEPFCGIQSVLEENKDMDTDIDFFQAAPERIMVAGTDVGQKLSDNVRNLELLLEAYRSGVLRPQAPKKRT
ncbi:MAG: fructose-1,6-bisphosphatase [Oscillospiraceae bacterium]|nr:fructose-1,6-bisphosphatase [Oscillospiraceae bacterium]